MVPDNGLQGAHLGKEKKGKRVSALLLTSDSTKVTMAALLKGRRGRKHRHEGFQGVWRQVKLPSTTYVISESDRMTKRNDISMDYALVYGCVDNNELLNQIVIRFLLWMLNCSVIVASSCGGCALLLLTQICFCSSKV